MPPRCPICDQEPPCGCDPKDQRIAELEAQNKMLNGAIEGWQKVERRRAASAVADFDNLPLWIRDMLYREVRESINPDFRARELWGSIAKEASA